MITGMEPFHLGGKSFSMAVHKSKLQIVLVARWKFYSDEKLVVWDSAYVIILHPPLADHVVAHTRVANFAIFDWKKCEIFTWLQDPGYYGKISVLYFKSGRTPAASSLVIRSTRLNWRLQTPTWHHYWITKPQFGVSHPYLNQTTKFGCSWCTTTYGVSKTTHGVSKKNTFG